MPIQKYPLTEIWFQRRKKCQRCVALRTQHGGHGHTIMRCAAVVWHDSKRSRQLIPATGAEQPFNHLPYCIDASDTGQPCGSDARLFKEKPDEPR